MSCGYNKKKPSDKHLSIWDHLVLQCSVPTTTKPLRLLQPKKNTTNFSELVELIHNSPVKHDHLTLSKEIYRWPAQSPASHLPSLGAFFNKTSFSSTGPVIGCLVEKKEYDYTSNHMGFGPTRTTDTPCPHSERTQVQSILQKG